MTTYRLFPSTNGPSAATSQGSSFVTGLCFTLTNFSWFEGYWLWVCNTGQSTAPVKCALWSPQNYANVPNSGYVVPGSVVTSGTLTAGQWNYIPLPKPIPLAAGRGPQGAYDVSYLAAIGVNGPCGTTTTWWSTNASNGITSGPLFGYGTASGFQPPTGSDQNCYTGSGNDPSLVMPNTGNENGDQFWLDVQISNTASYSGNYRLFPGVYTSPNNVQTDASVAYSVAVETDISQPVNALYVHYFVPQGAVTAAGLATSVKIWDTSTQTAVAHISNPTWTAEDGTAPPAFSSTVGFWVKAAFPAGTVISAGKYRVSVYNANGANGGWNAHDASSNWFVSGAGPYGNGFTWGPITAPNQATAQLANYYPGTGSGTTGGQPVFAYSGTDIYPTYTTGTNPAQNYWVDLEVFPVNSGLLISCFP
jgi:hypothetical protein